MKKQHFGRSTEFESATALSNSVECNLGRWLQHSLRRVELEATSAGGRSLRSLARHRACRRIILEFVREVGVIILGLHFSIIFGIYLRGVADASRCTRRLSRSLKHLLRCAGHGFGSAVLDSVGFGCVEFPRSIRATEKATFIRLAIRRSDEYAVFRRLGGIFIGPHFIGSRPHNEEAI